MGRTVERSAPRDDSIEEETEIARRHLPDQIRQIRAIQASLSKLEGSEVEVGSTAKERRGMSTLQEDYSSSFWPGRYVDIC